MSNSALHKYKFSKPRCHRIQGSILTDFRRNLRERRNGSDISAGKIPHTSHVTCLFRIHSSQLPSHCIPTALNSSRASVCSFLSLTTAYTLLDDIRVTTMIPIKRNIGRVIPKCGTISMCNNQRRLRKAWKCTVLGLWSKEKHAWI